MTASACPACDGKWPSRDQLIADFSASTAYLHDDQFFPGWTVLVLKRHATELFDLTPRERSQLMDEVASVAKAVGTEFRAVKVNYALLGNLIPHIHWHVIPRLADDPAPRETVWSFAHASEPLGADERRQRIARLRQRLGA